ncbi:MAG: glycosyltransferase [Solirubrobacterales bacterium]
MNASSVAEPAMLELDLIVHRGQNAFFRELALALRDELVALGVGARVTESVREPRPGLAYALLPPHEYAWLTWGLLPRRVLRRTVFICAEQPGTHWFKADVAIARLGGAVLDINRAAVREFRDRGIPAEHLPIGWTPRWETPSEERDVDITFLGSLTDRRERLLAGYAPTLAEHRAQLVISDNRRPNTATSGSFIAGEDKRRLLARSKVLLNVHQDQRSYFEWLRVVEAIHCGAVVVSEPSSDHAPLVEGEHFVAGPAEELDGLAASIASDDDRRAEISGAARELIRSEQPLSASAERLAALAERVSTDPPPPPVFPGLRARAAVLRPRRVLRRGLLPVALRISPERYRLRAELKEARLEQIELRRRIGMLEETVRRGVPPPEVEPVHETPARKRGDAPAVSVITAVYNHAEHVAVALETVERGRFRDFELIVVDDGSDDGSGEVVREWMSAHTETQGLLLRHPANRGLPTTRNSAIEHARGRYVLMLDADNELFPNCLDRLVEALEADPEAAFAYGILQKFDETGPKGLLGVPGWDPRRLRVTNYIDALALVRREALEEAGGFDTDVRLYGWEDYDLWCGIAERGGYPAHVKEIVARYRADEGSMISLTNLDREGPRSVLAERYPKLFAGKLDRSR